jgi:hypothetical protein
MNKPYLLIAGDNYYPSAGSGDWIACFETKEAAEDYFKSSQEKLNSGQRFDWHRVVDLRDWAE